MRFLVTKQYPDPVDNTEHLVRYLVDSGKYVPSTGRVKHNAFMPAFDNVLSVFRVDRLTNSEIMKLGEDYVDSPPARVSKAVAIVQALVFMQNNLVLEPTPDPHPRHVDVKGWSDSESNRHKAQLIAAKSSLVLK